MNNIRERIGFILMWICTLFTATMIFVIFAFLYSNAADFFDEHSLKEFLLGINWKPSADEYGILPMIFGSVLTTTISLGIALPLGVLSVWFIHYYLPKRLQNVFDFIVNIMAAIPSVVYGLFGIKVLAPTVSKVFGGSGYSVITVGILLSLMILPTVMTLYLSELSALPNEYYISALALGESRERSIIKCVFPLSRYGIFSAGILALGRSIGETMAVLMVAGNVAKIPLRLTEGIRTLTTNISLEMGYAVGLHRSALIACGLVLLVMVLLLELLVFRINRKIVYEK